MEQAKIKESGSAWVKKALRCDDVSAFGERVADLLDVVMDGIYHIDQKSLSAVEWNNPRWIGIRWHGELATFDANILTRFVILSHDKMIRFSVNARSREYLQLEFTPRLYRTGSVFGRHPTLEQAAEDFRQIYDNPIDGERICNAGTAKVEGIPTR
jgi:hypothetical protein